MLQDSLDILVEVLGRFGHYVQDQHQALLTTLLPHLDDNRQGVRKRALQAVGGCEGALLKAAIAGCSRVHWPGGGVWQEGGRSAGQEATTAHRATCNQPWYPCNTLVMNAFWTRLAWLYHCVHDPACLLFCAVQVLCPPSLMTSC